MREIRDTNVSSNDEILNDCREIDQSGKIELCERRCFETKRSGGDGMTKCAV
jgi:hypothetical protein